jgi:hypothetical protein
VTPSSSTHHPAATDGPVAHEGPPTDGMLVLLAVSGLIVAIEAAAVIACFALLGTFLGIRRGGR